MHKTVLLTASVLTTLSSMSVSAHEVASAPIISAGDTTVVYVFPTSPQSFAPIVGLPSFLAMPGSDMPKVATQVIYSSTVPAVPTLSGIDVDCSNFTGAVTISGEDVFDLDQDGDGIGCEAQER